MHNLFRALSILFVFEQLSELFKSNLPISVCIQLGHKGLSFLLKWFFDDKHMTQLQMFQKVLSGGGPFFKVVLEF